MAYDPITGIDSEQDITPDYLRDLMDRRNAALRQRESDLDAAPKQMMDRIKMSENSVGPKLPDYTEEETRNAQAANATAMGTLGPVAGEAEALTPIGQRVSQSEAEALADLMGQSPMMKRAAQAQNVEAALASRKSPLSSLSGKSAEESAAAFESGASNPNFELQGQPYSKDFTLQGEPYGGSLSKLKPQPPALRPQTPEVLPPESAMLEGSSKFPATMKDIPTTGSGSVADEFSQEAANKLAIKLGISGTAAAAMLAKFAPEQNNAKPPIPTAKSKEVQPDPRFMPSPIEKIEQNQDQEKAFSKVTSREPSAEQDQISDLLKSAQSQSLASDANLKDAQNRADKVAMVNQLGKAANVIGAGIAKATPANQELFDQNIKQSEKIVSDLQERIKNQSNDPGSEVSRSARAMLSKVTGKSIPDNMSAATLDKIQPGLMQLVAKQEAAKQHKEEMQFRYSQLAAQKDIAKQDKKEATNTKRFDTMNKLLTDEIASSRGAFGKAANIIRSSEAIEQLVGTGDPNNLDSRQITEVARNLDAMLSSGQATISGMKKLLPETAMGSAAKIQEYIMNQPKGAQQGEFVKRMVETVQREKDLAKDQLVRTKGKMLGSYSDLRESNPEKWDQIMRLHSIPSDVFDEESIKSRENKSPSQYTPAQESGISAFMSSHPELDRDKAIKILKDNKRL